MRTLNLISPTGLTLRLSCLLVGIFSQFELRAQHITELRNLEAFRDPGPSWKMAGGAIADLVKPNVLLLSRGTDVLVNLPDKKNHGKDLYSKEEFGDMDLALDFMMANGSNSGIYLQGRYEVQLEDTWGSRTTDAGKNGGIYERWDDTRPDGQKGYGGKAPRQNTSRAPGLWQQLKISFQAPRFDASGRKIENAKMLKVELNGVLIHENVDLSGPTRGGGIEEAATGPLRIQGDHGAVAFRNITIKTFQKPRPANEEANAPRRIYPILVSASSHPVFRSFMDIANGPRVVHAVSVGSSENVHYTYDTDTGMIIQLWRGEFLDATPMWYSRGDGSSRPAGAVLRLGNPMPCVAKLENSQSVWRSDTAGTGFRPKGYSLNVADIPVFHYQIHGVTITDMVSPLPDGTGISREIAMEKSTARLYVRMAAASMISEIAKDLYVVGDHEYYLRLDDVGRDAAIIRDMGGNKELIVPISTRLKYSILF